MESKILGLRKVPIAQVNQFRFGNPRHMSGSMRSSLAKSFETFGVIETPVVREVEGESERFEILNGHHRYAELVRLGAREVEVVVVSMPDDNKARALALALNNIGADWDVQALGKFMEGFEIQWLSDVTGFEAEDLHALAEKGAAAFAQASGESFAISDVKHLVKTNIEEELSVESVVFSLKFTPEEYDLLTRAIRHARQKVWKGVKGNEAFIRIFQSMLGEAPDAKYTIPSKKNKSRD